MKIASSFLSKRGISSSHLVPKEGTNLREAFDLFQSNKGISIDYRYQRGHSLISQLTDFYGLDIRNLSRNRWLLAGEWFGSVYVDYVADRFHAAERAQKRVRS